MPVLPLESQCVAKFVGQGCRWMILCEKYDIWIRQCVTPPFVAVVSVPGVRPPGHDVGHVIHVDAGGIVELCGSQGTQLAAAVSYFRGVGAGVDNNLCGIELDAGRFPSNRAEASLISSRAMALSSLEGTRAISLTLSRSLVDTGNGCVRSWVHAGSETSCIACPTAKAATSEGHPVVEDMLEPTGMKVRAPEHLESQAGGAGRHSGQEDDVFPWWNEFDRVLLGSGPPPFDGLPVPGSGGLFVPSPGAHAQARESARMVNSPTAPAVWPGRQGCRRALGHITGAICLAAGERCLLHHLRPASVTWSNRPPRRTSGPNN